MVSPTRLDDTWVLTNANFSPSGPVNLVSVTLSAIAAGDPPTVLMVRGTGFTPASLLLFNDLPFMTTFVNPTQINAITDRFFNASPGQRSLQVENSNLIILDVLNPTVTSLSPSSIGQGAPSFLLTVNGSNFNSSSLVLLSSFGGPLSTTFVNSNQLIAQVPASAVASSGNLGLFVVVDDFLSTGLSNTVTFTVGPPALTCNANGGVPIQRFQGSAEPLGDVILACNGGTPNQVLTSDITVFALPLCPKGTGCTVNLTSRILNAGTQATEALLLIDDPGSPQAPNTPQVLNTNVFQGILTAPNAITFRSVPIVQPGSSGSRVLRIVNLRENVHQIGQINSLTPSPINVVVSLTGGVILNNPQVLTGFVAPSSFRPRVSVASLSDQRSVQVSFTEDFPAAFKTRVAAGGLQNVPGVLYNTESGFVNPALLSNAGLADSATRLLVKLTGVPNGVNVYAQVFPNGNTNAQLVATDSNGSGAASFIPGVAMFGGTYSQVPISAGSGVAVWEVTSTNPFSIETLQFRIMLTGMTQPNLGPIALVASPAPLSPTNTASTSSPLPRFGTDSITNFVNLTLTSNSVATGPGGTAVLPSTRPSERLRPAAAAAPPQVQVGSNLSFTYTLTNNGPGPAPQVTVQANLPSTLSFVNCVTFTIGIVTSALPASGTASGMVVLTAPNNTTSPTVNVTAAIGASTKPFGSFDTPVDGTKNIAGAVPVTGWALDSIEVVKVDIWREPVAGEAAGSGGLVPIGDAGFVFGARPDVQAANPGLPFNTRGGWGYQILTNFLPNATGSGPSGNGVYKLPHNKAGVSADLGTKTITVDNGHAALPFGTIDTPSQGGTASGSAYVNFAWALTPNPNKIPIDGSTLTVVIDGQPVGHPVYNNFRSDIATLFPGYMNSGGAVGYYYLDTTKLSNGIHTISWNAFDNANNGQGLGSRYFNVFNSGGPVAAPEEEAIEPATITRAQAVEIEEVGHIKLPLGAIKGYQLVDGQRVPLPIGSSLKRGVFYWQPGPGFLGDYTLVFQRADGSEAQIQVKIRPKTYTHTTDR